MAKKNKILITGAFGFIGSHLAEFLIERGFEVIVFDRYNSNSNYGWLNNSKHINDIEFILGDIRDYDSVSYDHRWRPSIANIPGISSPSLYRGQIQNNMLIRMMIRVRAPIPITLK